MTRGHLRVRFVATALAILLAGCSGFPDSPKGGVRVEKPAPYSAAMGRPWPFAVVLPASYDQHPEKRYPVLYLLHGHGGRNPYFRTCTICLHSNADRPRMCCTRR